MHDDYLALLPEELRPRPLPARRSTWWRWRDMDVHIERVGESDAPRRALLLHGAGGNAAAMWPVAAQLAGHGVELIVPDLPGFGRTRAPRRGALRLAHWIDLACDLLRAERRDDARPLTLIGASMSGMIAYEVAARTGLADRVVVTCLVDPRDARVRRKAARYPWLGAVARPVLRWAAGPLAGVEMPLRLLVNMRKMSNVPALVDLVLRDRRGGGNRMPLGFVRSFLDAVPSVEPERFTACEIVLAHPAADGWTPVEISLPFFDRIAGPRRLVMLPDAGHFPIEAAGMRTLVELLAEGRRPGESGGGRASARP
ncbi:alpha-beta hydrolase superfamily lysophospholipase [Actinoalloteichus hoggarensis]|uniref:alpha/beta hydrolase n=1 Tax=Actinoalloteichus hoggarensis TaxID=1470176 RepID=UPI000B8AEC5A|nr:alpha/beta fold hydrolase [Actinoalloteichus hoggarensis]MBB5919463.1 alpha-beta hydrolase superfamily lysophospholipase [Actinoalloteichus hoggarensis]